MNAEKVGHHSCVCQWCQALARPAIIRVALNKCGTQCVALFHIVWQVVLHWGERKTEVPEAQRERSLYSHQGPAARARHARILKNDPSSHMLLLIAPDFPLCFMTDLDRNIDLELDLRQGMETLMII